MKTRLSVIAPFALGVVVMTLAAGSTTPANAGTSGDALSQCLVQSTTEQDKNDLVRWMFASEAQHPAVAQFATVPPDQRAELSQTVAALFGRLLTQDCLAEFREARRNEGEETVSLSFNILVQTALQGLIGNPTVSSALAGVDDHLDKMKIGAAMMGAAPPIEERSGASARPDRAPRE